MVSETGVRAAQTAIARELTGRGIPWAAAGRHGGDVRSDCRVTVWAEPQGPAQVQVASKVQLLYGEAIRRQAAQVLAALGAADLSLRIEDSGSLPFTLAARIEAAVRRLRPHTAQTALPPRHPSASPQSGPRVRRASLRRTRLYLPGVTPKLLINAGLYGADALVLDLEDSVPAAEKDTAALLVRNALRAVDFYGAERMVRVNALPGGLAEMRLLAPHGVDTFVLPKVEQADEVAAAAGLLDEVQAESGADIALLPIVESARGVLNAYAIAAASPRVAALAIGLEDYVSDIGALRTPGGRESEWACGQVLNAARAAGVQPLASVYADVADAEGLAAWVRAQRRRGFEGIGCLHPSQVRVAHAALCPSAAEIEEAQAIVGAYEEALAAGSGATAVGGRMVDLPVVKRAQRTLALAGGAAGPFAATQDKEGEPGE